MVVGSVSVEERGRRQPPAWSKLPNSRRKLAIRAESSMTRSLIARRSVERKVKFSDADGSLAIVFRNPVSNRLVTDWCCQKKECNQKCNSSVKKNRCFLVQTS